MKGDIFFLFTSCWIGLAILIFFINLKIRAPYGRHSSTSWGPMMDNRWGWIIMELPALLVCPLFFFYGDGEKSFINYSIIILWVSHYFNRTIIFPFRIRTSGKKMPILIVFLGILFNIINGFICGHHLGNAYYETNWVNSFPFIIGCIIFFSGWFINIHSDHILIHLRKPGETGYKIPEGGLFKWVSCPNHFGEILEWFGFVILCWALPCFSFFVWTFCNLVPRALAHHKWYQEKFKEYPPERHAIFPWIL